MRASGFVLKILYAVSVVLLIIIVAFIFFISCLQDINNQRTKRAIEHGGLVSIMKIGKTFSQYYEHNNQLPQNSVWCNKLMEYYMEEGLVKKYLFNIPQLTQVGPIEYHFAFNKNLSLSSKKDLPGNLVLVFEADGEFNLSGGPELLKKKYAKDSFFLSRIFIFIFCF